MGSPAFQDARVRSLMEDASLDGAARIATLRRWRDDARAKARAETEGGMTGPDDDAASLREIELALEALGAPAEEGDGPATL